LRVWWTPHAPRRRSTTGDARRAQQPRTVGKTSRPRTAVGRTRQQCSRHEWQTPGACYTVPST
jgi:hypothetical protein